MLIPSLLLFCIFVQDSISAFAPSAHSASRSRFSGRSTIPPFARLSSLNARGRRKKKDDAAFSIASVPFLSDDKSAVTSGMETLLMLSDAKRQAVWKDDMKKQYPFVPGVFVDMFADSAVSAFSAIAPAEIQMVAQPGGLEKVKSKLERTIKKELKKNDMYAGLPLSDDDKDKLLANLIGASLGILLQDAAMVLAHPSEKLQALEEEKRQVTRFMTKRQRVWYQLKYHTVRSALVVAASAIVLTLLYNGYKSTAIVQTIEKSVIKIWLLAKSLVTGVTGLVLGSKKGRRTRVRRRVR